MPKFPITSTAVSPPELVIVVIVTFPVKPHSRLLLGATGTAGARAFAQDPVLGTSKL